MFSTKSGGAVFNGFVISTSAVLHPDKKEQNLLYYYNQSNGKVR